MISGREKKCDSNEKEMSENDVAGCKQTPVRQKKKKKITIEK